MWCFPGLIVINLAIVVEAFELKCVVNYYSNVNAIVYVGEGGEKLRAFNALMARGTLLWAIVDGQAGLSTVAGDPGNYLVFARGGNAETNLRHALGNLSSIEMNWRPSARMFVILPTSNLLKNRKLASQLIDILWGYSVFNSVVILESEVEGSEYRAYSASPFDESNECGMVVRKVRKMLCGRSETFKADSTMLWPLPETYPTCSLNVSRRHSPPFTFRVENEWRGADIRFIHLLSEKKHLNIIWSERPSPETTASTEVLHQYYDNFSRNGLDLAIGACTMRSGYLNKVHYSRPYAQHGLIHYVADPDYMDGWEMVHTMFSTPVWCILGMSLIIAGICYNMLLESDFGLRHSKALFFIAILLAQPIRLPGRWRHRLFLGVFILTLYHISSLYLANLQSFVVHPPKNKSITTIRALSASNMTVMLSNTTYRQIRNSLGSSNVDISTTPLDQRLAYLEKHKNFSVLARSLEIDFWRNLLHYRIHPITPGLSILSVSMAMGKGNQYASIVDGLLQQCLESGLFAKWIRDLTTVLSSKVKKITKSDRDVQQFNGLEFAFFMLLAGHLISSLVFIGEHLCRWSQMRFSKKINVRNPRREIRR